MDNRPIGIDLFAGAGGLSLGFEQAGFDVVAAVEIDPIHAAVHHYNFQSTTVLPKSVIGLSGKEIRKEAGLGNRKIDVVFGGPPCQGFSLIGHRMLDDARNQLVKEFVRLVAELDASAFVFENVKGLTIGKHRLFLENLIAEFEAAGYSVQLPWRVLNAKHYGVPQDRQRLFIMGAKKGRQLPSYPDPIVQTEAGLFEKGKRPLTTCYDALCDLPDAESYDELLFSDSAICAEWGNASWYSKEMRCLNKTSWHNGYVRKWDPDFLTSSMRTYHTEASRKRFASTGEGEIEPISRFFKLARKGVCNTLRAGTDSARGAFTSPRPIHYTHARCITVREMARLHGYPDWFRFHATKWHGARQIGNSVPPPLGRFVAGQIIAALGMKPTRPNAKVPLGDTSLLSMDMSEAAAFWGVPIIIGKRDRKAGLTSKKATAENTDPLETRKVS